ncbi:hypothetical protein WA026_006251 [Henosepilachna vigintioctopunctata]|uniref:Uncharacterized protein n=1 Tax=Henosepilachna vigintioctopunctata TaxID=420089 RepID=A0AAW1TI32_9CUCU
MFIVCPEIFPIFSVLFVERVTEITKVFFSDILLRRFRRERKTRRQLGDRLETEKKRRSQLEDALKNAGASEDLRRINDNFCTSENKSNIHYKVPLPSSSSQNQRSTPNSLEKEQLPHDRQERPKQEAIDTTPPISYPQPIREPPPPPPQQMESKPWCYSGIDLMNNGAAFWQSYSDSLAQELEMERKSRQQQMERDEKPTLQDRSAYYKNSVLFTSSAT